MPFVVAQPRFPHRMNKDGTIDSICPRCYATIGTSTWEADLERIEAGHVCDASRLSHFDDQRRKPVLRQEPPSKESRRMAESRKCAYPIAKPETALHA